MASALMVRSTSTAAAALTVGLLAAAALSMQFQYFVQPLEQPPIIISTPAPRDPPPPDPPTVKQETLRPPQPLEEFAPISISDPTAPLLPYAGPAPAPEPAGPVQITDPRWARRPSGLAGYYPRRALELGREGVVVLDCLVDLEGALHCAVASETPSSWGFGEAALRISRDYRMEPAMREGRPVEGRYRMRLPFQIG